MIDVPLDYSYRGSVTMSVGATFFTDEKGTVTASINVPYKPAEPQPLSIDAPKGTVRRVSPLKDPNEPHSFKFNLTSLSGRQLDALAAAAAKQKNDPISKALLDAIAKEQKRREEQAKKEERQQSPPPAQAQTSTN